MKNKERLKYIWCFGATHRTYIHTYTHAYTRPVEKAPTAWPSWSQMHGVKWSDTLLHTHMHIYTWTYIHTSNWEDSNCLADIVAEAWCEMKSGSTVGKDDGARPMSLNSVWGRSTVYLCMYICYMHAFCPRRCTYIYIYIHTHTHTYTYSHIHAFRQRQCEAHILELILRNDHYLRVWVCVHVNSRRSLHTVTGSLPCASTWQRTGHGHHMWVYYIYIYTYIYGR